MPAANSLFKVTPMRLAAALVLVVAASAVVVPFPAPTASAQAPETAPATPSQVTVTRADGSLTASWPAVDGATSYHVTYTSDGKQSWALAALNHPSASITIGGVDNTKTYFVAVRARNAGGDSGWRDSAAAGPFTPPTPTPTPTPVPTSTPEPAPALSFGDAAVADQSYAKDTAIDTLTLPAASRSSEGASATVGTITYSLSPALPAGLSFDATARTISGTPTEAAATATYTYTATYGTDTALLSFAITVAAVAAQEEGAQGQANQAPQTIASTFNFHYRGSGADTDCYHNRSVSHPSGENSYFEDPDGDTLTITSTSSHPGLVEIKQHDPVRIRANHPADTWVTITTTATDPGGLSADFVWQFKMTCTTNSKLSVNENSASGTDVGKVGVYNGGASNWTIEGDASNSFTISSSNGLVEVKSGATLDYETKTSYSGTVKYDVVSGGTTYKSDRAVTITLNDVTGPAKADAPTVSRNKNAPSTSLSVSGTAPSSTHSGGITGYAVRHRQTGASSWTTFQGNGSNITVSLNNLTTGKSYDVQLRGTDAEGDGAWSNTATGITEYSVGNLSVAENSAAGTNIGAAVDADSNPNGYTLAYSLGGTDASSFDIVSTSGQIRVKTGNIPDYETKKQYSVTVTMAASGGSSTGTGNTGLSPNGTGNYAIRATINVTNVNEGPEFSAATATRSIAENSAANTNVGAAVTAGADPEGDTVTYSLTGTDASKFDIGSSTGQITVKTGNIPDYEAKTSYSVTVNATDKKKADGTADTAIDDTIAVTINVTDVSEPPSAPAAPTVTANSTKPSTKLDVSWTAPTMTGKPAISDYDVQYRLSGDSTWTSHSFTGTGTSTTLTGLTTGKTYEVQVQATNDEGDSAWSGSGTAITDADAVSRSVAENAAAGTSVGAAVTVTSNTNSYTLTHSLGGTDAGKFTIESSSGQIKVKTGTSLDYETKSSYSVTVTVAAAVAQSQSLDPNAPGNYVIPVTINVTNVNEAPEFSAATATRSIAENSAADTNVGTAVAATDPEGDTLTYSLTGTDAGKFDIGSGTGQITVKTGNIPDYEAKTSYSVTVNVTDKKKADGTADTAIDDTIAVTINVTDVSEPPPKMATPTVAANTTTPTTKIDVSWTAPTTTQMSGKPAVSGYDVQYRLSGDSDWTDASFTGTGTSTTLTGLTAGKSYEVQVRAVNAEGDGAWSDSGSAITKAGGVTRSIAENSAAGTSVGAAVTATANTNGYTLTHSLGGTDAGKFTIESSSGQIKVKSGTSLDYETKTSYSVIVTVKAAAAGAQSESLDPNAPGDYLVPVTINVTNVNEGPEFSAATAARSIAENSASGTSVGAAVTAGADPEGDTVTYSLTGTDAGKFDIGSATGQITVKSGTTLDYESKTSYSVTVNATDKKKADGTANTAIDDTIAVTINVTDVSEPPPKMAAPTVAANSTTPATKIDVSWTAPTTAQMSGKPAVGDYDVQYRKVGDAAWTSHSFTGTGTSTTLTGLTEGKTYEVQVRAVSDEGNGAWSGSGSAITDANAVSRSVAENSAAGTSVGAAVTVISNPNGYDLTHSLSGTDAGKFTIDSSSGQIKVKTGTSLDYETKTSFSVTVTVAAAAAQVQSESLTPNAPGDYVIPVTINVTNVNEKPEFSASTATRSIAENSASGTSVGAAVTAGADPEGDTLTYSLTGTDAGKFDIGSATGQITVKTGNIPDYEAETSYSVTVNVTDKKKADGTADTAIDDTISVTINVTDVNEPPPKPAAPTVSANSATPASKIDAAWTAPDMTGKPAISDYDVRYRLSGGSAWTSHSFSGTGTSTTITGLTSGKTYEVQVRATNAEGDGAWSDSGTAITRAGGMTRSVAENSAAGTGIGSAVTATSNPNSYDLTHSLSGTDAGSFTIDSGSGQIKVSSALDYETKKSYSVVVTVSAAVAGAQSESLEPNAPGSYKVPVTITVTDVNEPPQFPADTAARSVAENSAAGTAIGAAFTATDQDGDTLYYSLSGTDAASFDIGEGTGQIAVRSGKVPDHEAKSSYSVTVNVTDKKKADGTADPAVDDTIAVTISIADVAEPPAKPAAPTVSANSATPTTKIDAAWTAPDMTGKPAITDYDVRYRKVGDSTWTQHSFSGTGTSTAITGLTSGKTYEVQVRATNDEGTSAWSASGTAITTAGGVALSIAENSAAGTAIGFPVTASSNPNGYTLSHTMSGTDAASFSIESSSGQIKVKSALDYETKKSYSVIVTVRAAAAQVQATSLDPNAPGSYLVPVTITVTDVNEVARFTDPAGHRVAENSPFGTKIGAPVTATDPDGDVLTYSLSGTDASKFDIDGATGQIELGQGTNLDYESGPTSFSVTVNATDGKGEGGNPDPAIDHSTDVSIGVTDVLEPPDAPAAPGVSPAASALDITWTAPRMGGKPPITDYDVHYRRVGDSNWISHPFTGTGTAATITGLSAGETYEVRVNATNDEGTSPWSDSSTGKPQVTAAVPGVTRSVAENSPAGTSVGAPVTASSNPSGYDLIHSLGGSDASMFAIDSASGQITVGTGTSLDYETQTTYGVVVTVRASVAQTTGLSPNSPGSYTIPVTINVTDVSNGAPSFDEGATAFRQVAVGSGAGTGVGASVTATDPDGDALTYSLTGADAASFDIDAATGQIKVGSAALNKDSYSVAVYVSDRRDSDGRADTADDDVIDITINTTSATTAAPQPTPRTKRPPGKPDAPSVKADPGSPTSALAVEWTAPSNAGPAITAYRLRYRVQGTSLWTAHPLSGTATEATIGDLGSGRSYEVQVRAVNADGAGPWSDSGTGSTAVGNAGPAFPGSATARTVAENSPAGTAVGDPVTATDPDGDALTYSLGGSSDFAIDTATGQISVAAGASIDYETTRSYAVTVSASDGLSASGGSDPAVDTSITVTIHVIDVDEPEPKIQRIETTEESTQPESSSQPEAQAAKPNSPPSLDDLGVLEVAENSPAGTAVGDPVTATDPDGDALTFAVSGADEFTIDPATGQISVAAGAELDHESVSSYEVTVSVSDGVDAAGNPDSAADDSADVTIAVTDVAEPPARPDAPSVARGQDSPISTLIAGWDAPVTTGPAITGYELRYRAEGAADWTDHPVSGTAATAAIGGLESGTGYEVQVRAINDEGAGPWSASGTGSTARPHGDPVYPIHEGGIAKGSVQTELRITQPGDKVYGPGETITPFAITVSGGPATVGVAGLPDGLAYSGGQVSGTVAEDAATGTYTVTITATGDDGAAATAEFSITLVEPDATLQANAFTIPAWLVAAIVVPLLAIVIAARRWLLGLLAGLALLLVPAYRRYRSRRRGAALQQGPTRSA